ncbi:nucleoside diphosphate kinase cytosolic [Anaeramoeba flamelloides]|uniref:Nucleoside diphosphate kinase n=1 Tax=Anaeramoeba flamelloides TaxID=1746091 RepID=A0AAV7ZDH9_9EUKA|nr:nucleoside diphosphate kinase cytosolic [Anaeramoeba flamelloides]
MEKKKKKNSQNYSKKKWIVAAGIGILLSGLGYYFYNQQCCEKDLETEERTFVAIKPDGVQRKLIGEIVRRFEKKGLKLVGCKLIQPSRKLAEKHYAEHKGKPFYEGLLDFITSGPVFAMVWEGKEVVSTSRSLIGLTDPKKSPMNTIRGDFGIDVGRNTIHGSDSVESAQREIKLWFSKNELITSSITIEKWINED